jgi:hypothetical protein
VRECGLDSSGSGWEPVAVPFENSNELSGYTRKNQKVTLITERCSSLVHASKGAAILAVC